MTTWVYPREGEPYEKGTRDNVSGIIVMGDGHYDIGDPRFSTREQHRRYMREHNVRLIEPGEIPEAAKERAAFYERAPDPSRPGDIARAIEMVRQGHRPRRIEEL